MRNKLQIVLGFIVLGTPVAVYLYTFWLSLKLFMFPAFGLYFDMYGIAGTFGIWLGLFLMGFASSFTFFRLWMYTPKSSPLESMTFKD